MEQRRRPLTRSEMMARVKSRDTGPELALRRALWARGWHYRLQLDLPCRPDLAFPKARLAVFVDGCFWHGCPQHYSAPRTRFAFWAEKIRRNIERDAEVDATLRTLGWRVLHIWQHELTDMEATIALVEEALRHDTAPGALLTSEPEAPYGYLPWWSCTCGSTDVQVQRVSDPGSLKATAATRPRLADLRCRRCGTIRLEVQTWS
ncbi:MAG: very short patch repair endonuclease [Pseudomonadota bacterium]